MLKLFVLFFSSILCLEIKPRISGGTDVGNRPQFAYQVELLYKGAPSCGGAIIDRKHIVTAAQCCQPNSKLKVEPSELSVVVANLNLYDFSSVKQVQYIFVHGDFDTRSYHNDIAVIRILDEFTWTKDIQPIKLNTFQATDGNCLVSSWGAVDYNSYELSTSLRFAAVEIVDWNICKNLTLDPGPNTICAGSAAHFCHGDQGAPLICNDFLTGIASYGYGCAQGNMPGVYTDIAKYTEWIEKQIQRTSSVALDNSTRVLIVTLLFLKFV